MKTIKLSDAMKQLPVAEAVKNLYGSDTNGALSQFTMDRIAAVAGGLQFKGDTKTFAIWESGFYNVAVNGAVPEPQIPDSNYGILIVLNAGYYAAQLFIPRSSGSLYIRMSTIDSTEQTIGKWVMFTGGYIA